MGVMEEKEEETECQENKMKHRRSECCWWRLERRRLSKSAPNKEGSGHGPGELLPPGDTHLLKGHKRASQAEHNRRDLSQRVTS